MVQKLFLVFFQRYFLCVSNISQDPINERRNLPILASSSYSEAQS